MNNVEAFIKEGILIDPELNEDLKNIKTPLVDIIKALNIKFLSRKDFEKNYPKIKLILENLRDRKSGEEREYIEQALVYLSKVMIGKPIEGDAVLKDKAPEIKKAEKAIKEHGSVRVLKCYDLPPRDITVGDFVEYFKSRYTALKSILQDHGELSNLSLIDKVSPNSKNISIIGMVYSKSITKNKNIMLQIEDLTGRIPVLVSVNKPDLIKKCSQIVMDEVIGIKCSGSSEILFANDIVFPDVELSGNKRRTENEEYAVFTSDIHVGSNIFQEDKFLKFIEWINGNSVDEAHREKSKKIKYLFITGDSVDGVGVYPGQEDKLALKDIRQQYQRLYELLSKIRKDITIIMCPGQHDSVRVHEPQPPIGTDYAEPIYRLENIMLVSNPAFIEIGKTKNSEGVRVLMYHGASFYTMINEIEELRFGNANETPTKVIKHWLKKRHLGPPHSTTTHIPIPEGDPLVIKEVPEILVTGDMHRTDVDHYKGVLMINSSCWQKRTDFEEKIGKIPDPCKTIMLNLKTWDIKIIDFN